ncbi:Complement C1r subcomponent-like protein [Sciurus carolinensis]|uniref:Complement C1r subcomponent-like protein n=1 Tax=Sciurus carolinensis TaxID=30640 RepID=A0AA41MR67_SCICA|nr:Complement C1r subcomponent-like protein [Sciurus carolinensis]
MPPNLTGYYRFVSQKNLEDYLQALNINVALRKIVLLLKPDKEIDHQGDHMVVKTLSTFRNYIMEFEVGVEFEEDLRIVDGRKCQTIVTWEEEHLVCVQKGEVPNRGWRHWLEGEKLHLELTARDAVCKQVFRKISASGMDLSRLCGKQGSPLASTPGQREFVSSGRRLRLTFHAHTSSKDKTICLHKGFLTLFQAVVCGQPVTPITQNPKTLGSSRAKLGNFPWQAFTSIYGRGGGALLGDRWILTAAHTIQPKDSIYLRKNQSVNVFLGHTDIAEMLKVGNYPVRHVFVHPEYNQSESHNFNGDIALLELEHSIPLGPNLLPVCLPDNESLYLNGLWGYVSGFGVEMGWLTEELKYSRLPVAPREACEAWLRERHRTEVFSDNMFCVGDKMQTNGVCQGDSGSVYVVWDDHTHRWVATGIVSWGIGCGKGYGFYTKVLNYVDWIKGVMDSKD